MAHTLGKSTVDDVWIGGTILWEYFVPWIAARMRQRSKAWAISANSRVDPETQKEANTWHSLCMKRVATRRKR